MTLLRTIAPSETPVTLTEAKAHLRVDHSDEDTYISSLIDAAAAMIDGSGSLGRAMVTQTWAQWVAPAPGVVRVPMGPFIALTDVSYYDTDSVLQAATLSDFEVRLDGDFVTVQPKTGKAWPTTDPRKDAIRITFTAGFGAASDVPSGLKHAILLLVGLWYEHREAASDLTLKDIPKGVDALIGMERVGWYG